MSFLQQNKLPFILLCVGFIVRVIAAMMKILHWPGADLGLAVGTIIIIASISWIIIKIAILKSAPKQ